MAVLRNSRYEGVEFTGIRGADGVVRKFLHQREPLGPPDATQLDVVVKELEAGEELDGQTFKTVQKALVWWVLADMNEVLFPLSSLRNDQRLPDFNPVTDGGMDGALDPGLPLAYAVDELRKRKEP